MPKVGVTGLILVDPIYNKVKSAMDVTVDHPVWEDVPTKGVEGTILNLVCDPRTPFRKLWLYTTEAVYMCADYTIGDPIWERKD